MKKETTIHIRLDSVLKENLEFISRHKKEKLSKVVRLALEEFVEYNIENTNLIKETRIIIDNL